MSDFREIKREQIDIEIRCYLSNYRIGLEYHDDTLVANSEAILDKLPKFVCNIGAITDSDKEELVKKINKEKEKIKEEFKYGCM